MFSKKSLKSDTLFQNRDTIEPKIRDEQILHSIEYLNGSGNNTLKNREAIYNCPEHAVEISVGLNILHENTCLTDQNRFRVCANAKYAKTIADAIVVLSKAGIYELSTWLLVAKYPESAAATACVFSHLEKAGIRTDENQTKIYKIASYGFTKKSNSYQDAEQIALAIPFLNGFGSGDKFREQFTQEVYDKLCCNPKDAMQIIENINNDFDLRKSNTLK